MTIYGRLGRSASSAWAGQSGLRSPLLVRSMWFGRFKVTTYGTLFSEMLLLGPVRGRKEEVR